MRARGCAHLERVGVGDVCERVRCVRGGGGRTSHAVEAPGMPGRRRRGPPVRRETSDARCRSRLLSAGDAGRHGDRRARQRCNRKSTRGRAECRHRPRARRRASRALDTVVQVAATCQRQNDVDETKKNSRNLKIRPALRAASTSAVAITCTGASPRQERPRSRWPSSV